MIFFDLFEKSAQVILSVINYLDGVYLNVGTDIEVYTRYSLLDICEIIFGVSVFSSFIKYVFKRKESPE